MKKSIKILSLIAFLTITSLGMAQGPPDPDPDPTTGGNNDIGGNAPIGSGVGILLILCAAYGTRKILIVNKRL